MGTNIANYQTINWLDYIENMNDNEADEDYKVKDEEEEDDYEDQEDEEVYDDELIFSDDTDDFLENQERESLK